VRLSDVANVIECTENTRLAAWMNLSPAVIVNVQRQPGANIISVVDRIKKLLRSCRPRCRGGEGADSHRTDDDIRASVKDVEFELALTIVLVVIVIFFFLRNLRATFIPSVAVPLSIVRNLWRDVPAGLQPEQSDADGVDNFYWLRSG